jgi:nitrite reductase (NADH) large subunit
VPPVKGNDRADCFVYRTIEDLEAIRDAGARSQSGVVVGGGLLGLEAPRP